VEIITTRPVELLLARFRQTNPMRGERNDPTSAGDKSRQYFRGCESNYCRLRRRNDSTTEQRETRGGSPAGARGRAGEHSGAREQLASLGARSRRSQACRIARACERRTKNESEDDSLVMRCHYRHYRIESRRFRKSRKRISAAIDQRLRQLDKIYLLARFSPARIAGRSSSLSSFFQFCFV
jgi:hypothetical protein